MKKEEIRQINKAKRKEMLSYEVCEKSKLAAEFLLNSEIYKNSKVIMLSGASLPHLAATVPSTVKPAPQRYAGKKVQNKPSGRKITLYTFSFPFNNRYNK